MGENASLGVHVPDIFMPTPRSLRPDERSDASVTRMGAAGARVRLAWAWAWAWMRGAWRGGVFLLLWPAWWALWLAAGGIPPWRAAVLFALAPWLAYGVARVSGNLAGAWLDRRGQADDQPSPTRDASRGRDALLALAGALLLALALEFLGNRLTLYLGAAALVMALGVPLVQRVSYLSQAALGVACAWGIPMAFAAVQGGVPPLGWLLLCAGTLWASGGWIWQAMAQREEDLRRGVRSVAILLGELDLLAQALVSGGMLVALVLVGQRAELGAAYFAALGVPALLIGAQFWIARRREPGACLRAFALGAWVGAAVFAGIVLGLALK